MDVFVLTKPLLCLDGIRRNSFVLTWLGSEPFIPSFFSKFNFSRVLFSRASLQNFQSNIILYILSGPIGTERRFQTHQRANRYRLNFSEQISVIMDGGCLHGVQGRGKNFLQIIIYS